MQGAQAQCSVANYRGGMGWEVGGRFKREGTYGSLMVDSYDSYQLMVDSY